MGMQNAESSTALSNTSDSSATMSVHNTDPKPEVPADGLTPGAPSDIEDRNGQHHPIAEFLYQLTKMLTDDNSEIIEWADGRIRVHQPERLEAEVLHKYFRHSKFASFQRQLNYFGFRKIAGKGKMSPCSYVNDAATSDIRSLLLIKRKTNGSAARKAALQQRAAALGAATFNPALAGLNLQALSNGGQGLAVLNGQALQSAMALLQQNALRAGLGHVQGGDASNALNILALQQAGLLQQPQIIAAQPAPAQQVLQQTNFAAAAQPPQAQPPLAAANPPAASSQPTIEQLQAQLASFVQNSGLNTNSTVLSSSLNQSSSPSPSAPATAALKQEAQNPATAALQQAAWNASSMPATAAMDAATATNSANPFDSAANLKSLLNEHAGANNNNNNDAAAASSNNLSSNQLLLNRLPSSGTIFPENSTVSFNNMLNSSNRLSSLLSLTSWGGSREHSLLDLAAATNAHLAAATAAPGSMTQQQLQQTLADAGRRTAS